MLKRDNVKYGYKRKVVIEEKLMKNQHFIFLLHIIYSLLINDGLFTVIIS